MSLSIFSRAPLAVVADDIVRDCGVGSLVARFFAGFCGCAGVCGVVDCADDATGAGFL